MFWIWQTFIQRQKSSGDHFLISFTLNSIPLLVDILGVTKMIQVVLSILIFQVAIVAFGLFSGGATGRSSIGSLTEGADMSLSQVTRMVMAMVTMMTVVRWGS